MSRILRFGLISFSFLCLSACGPAQEETSQPNFTTGAALTRGHEDITRIGVDRANDALQGIVGYRPYPSIAKGVAAFDTGNQMVKGNYETDIPGRRMCAFHNEKFSDCDTTSYWHNSGHLQYLHSLRNFVNNVPVSMRQACENSRELIRRASFTAREAFLAGHVEDGRYWLGHATHTIQDSFSTAHARRKGADFTEICVYGIDVSGVCKHSNITDDDRIWLKTLPCTLDPNNRGTSCMKEEAKGAIIATTSYLTKVGTAIFSQADLDQSLQNFFVVDGYFNCEKY